MAAADRPRIVGGEVAVEVPARGTGGKGLSKALGATVPAPTPREGAEGRLVMHQGIGVGFSTLSDAKTVVDAAYAVAAPAPASGPRTAGRAARDAAEATRDRMEPSIGCVRRSALRKAEHNLRKEHMLYVTFISHIYGSES